MMDISGGGIISNRNRGFGNRIWRGRGSFGGRFSGSGRRGSFPLSTRVSQYTIAKQNRRTSGLPWQNDLFEDSIRAAGITGVEVGTKLYVSNLDHGVSNEDIRELFSEIGDLKRYAVHYDRNGHHSGSAEVVYSRRSDAFAAVKKYNNVLLDGKPMKIELVGANTDVPISARVRVTGNSGSATRTVVMMNGSGRGANYPFGNRASSRGGRGRLTGSRGSLMSGRGPASARGVRGRGRGRRAGTGRRRGRAKSTNIETTAGELDRELEDYMQT